MKRGDRVMTDLGEAGTILSVRLDENHEELYTIILDNRTATPDGFCVARRGEIIGGLNDFQLLMCQLDGALTGKGMRDVVHTTRDNEWDNVLDWALAQREWYLSDGGYSRIVATLEGHIFVTSNSTDRVKAAWSTCSRLVAQVEEAIRTAVKLAEGSDNG